MITFLCTPKHQYTLKNLQTIKTLEIKTLGYHRALKARHLPVATYVFTDLDRLNFWERELAARLYQRLKAAGARVLNDPARVRLRFSLLRQLHDLGLNAFNAWRVEDTSRPKQEDYPVFLRTESAHRGNLTDLLADESALASAIDQALAQGIPSSELLIVQYCAEPMQPNLFCKHATYRVGEMLIPAVPVHESDWSAKYGENGLCDAQTYRTELMQMQQNQFASAVHPAFEAASVEFGRADFGLVGKSVQVYEINTNPMIGQRRIKHAEPARVRAASLSFDRLTQALAQIDTKTGEKVRIDDPVLIQQRRMDRYLLRPRWTP